MYGIVQVLILCALSSLAASAAIPDESQATILDYKNTNDGSGQYRFSFKSSNGIFREEIGHLARAGEDDEHIVVEGSFPYITADGKVVVVYYKADQKGYRVSDSPADEGGLQLPPAVVATLVG